MHARPDVMAQVLVNHEANLRMAGSFQGRHGVQNSLRTDHSIPSSLKHSRWRVGIRNSLDAAGISRTADGGDRSPSIRV